MNKLFCLIIGVFITTMGYTLAVDVPAISPIEFSSENVVEYAHWVWTLLASEIIALIAGKIYFVLYDRIKSTRYGKLVQFVGSAVTACYHEYVRSVKASSANGKMTVDQKNQALQLAFDKAVEIAKSEGFDIMKYYAKETIMALIERLVGESKAPKAISGPLADLQY